MLRFGQFRLKKKFFVRKLFDGMHTKQFLVFFDAGLSFQIAAFVPQTPTGSSPLDLTVELPSPHPLGYNPPSSPKNRNS